MSNNRVFLLGAGFSMAISGDIPEKSRMPSMQELSDAVLEDVKHSRHRIPIYTSGEEAVLNAYDAFRPTLDAAPEELRAKFIDIYMALNNLVPESYLPGAGTPLEKNFERWLSYLVDNPPWLSPSQQARNRAAFLEISQSVARVVEGRQALTVVSQQECPPWFAQIVRHWDQESASVITFNYDQLVELAWLLYADRKPPRLRSWDLYPTPLTPITSRIGVTPPVYCVPGGFELFKMHGSLGWWYSGLDSPPSDTVYDQGVAGGEWGPEGIFAAGETYGSMYEDRQQMIVPPAAVKSPYYNNTILRAIWRKAAAKLNGADELVIMGFSLPATDMLVASLLATNVTRGCRIVPVDFDRSILDRICDTFAIRAEDPRLNKTYAGLRENAIPQWVADNVA